MKNCLKLLKTIPLGLVMLSSLGHAQSAGGGLGGDRGQFYGYKKPPVVEPDKMTCADLNNILDERKSVRVNFAAKKVQTFKVIFSRNTLRCGGNDSIEELPLKTLDRDRCWAGFICGNSSN